MSRNFNGNTIQIQLIPQNFWYNLRQNICLKSHQKLSQSMNMSKIFWGGGGECPQTPLEVFGFLYLSGSAMDCATPPNQNVYRSALALGHSYYRQSINMLLCFQLAT